MQTKYVPLLLLVATLAACNARQEQTTSADAAAPDPGYLQSADSVDLSSNVADMRSSSRKMVRTADFKCRVAHVLTAATVLERLVNSLSGVVEHSNLEQEVFATQRLPYKQDSLKEVRQYNTTAYMTLRVPAQHLDSVVQAIPMLVTSVDHRTISQNDLTLGYLTNALKNKAAEDKQSQEKAMQLARKTKDAIAAGNYNDAAADQVINRRMENLQMLDRVNYATLTVALSQPEQISTTVIMNPEYFAKPGFAVQFREALAGGRAIMVSLLLFLLHGWPLWLLLIATYIVYKKMVRKGVLTGRVAKWR